MQTVVLDFETAYGKGYSLRSMPTHQYVRDARSKIHGVGIQIEGNEPEWITTNIGDRLKAIDWANSCLVGHNLYFDGSILFEHFGIVPARRIDTLSLARGFFDSDQKFGLDAVAQMLGLGHKIGGTLNETKDKWDLEPELLARLGEYCLQDVKLTKEIYDILIQAYPANELDLIDLTIRMSTAPILEIDQTTAIRAQFEAEDDQAKAIKDSGLSKTILTSNQQFEAHLISLGIEIPKKISITTGKETSALGKNDPEFIELMGQYPELNHLWKGRLEAKSSIGVSRAKRWNFIATHGSRKMPMPMVYYGAHTGRWTGTDKINVQNLPRGSLLRKAIHAPKDHVILVADSSQIELRMNAWFCGQEDVLQTQREGKCVYSLMASKLFDRPAEDIYKEKGNDRQFGKIVILGCGYGMGWKKFKHFCASGPLGMAPIVLEDAEAFNTIQTYRGGNTAVVDMWKILNDQIIPAMKHSLEPFKFKCIEIRNQEIILPNGMSLQYPDLDCTEEGWHFGNNHPLWGGTLLENIIQALARIVVADQMLEIDKLDGVQVVGMTHDEVISVCHKDVAEERFNDCIRLMSVPPIWAPDVPLAAEGGWAVNYSK